ncbi:hypothetical protein, partial [Micromonospora andamanensis]
MTVYWYGGGPADWAMDLVTVDGTTLIPQMQPGATITCHSAQVGGDQYKDLALADGTPVEQITAAPGDTVYGPGTWPRFRGPVLSMWFSINDGPRVLVVSTDLPDVLQQALAAAQAAQAAASASAASAATLAGSSSVAGHLAAPDPHPQYANEQRGDARYVRAGDVGMVAPLQEPQQKLTFSETPAADDANMREIWVRHSDLITRLVAWENERGYPRREQVPGALWDNLYVAVAAYNGTGRAYAVQVRGIDGIRRDAGGFDAAGRPITSDQAWTPITSVDPDSTGDYAASTDVGPAPLAARWESNDVVRLQGRITAADVTDGDALAELPAGYHPLSERLVVLPTTSGETVPCDLLPNGRIVARATLAGPVDLALDDITYARILAEQETGDWSIESVAIATPGTSSPLALAHTGVVGRLYLLVLARSSAADAFTGVTDNEGNTWEQVVYAPTSGSVGRRIEYWICQPTDAFATISPAFTGAGTAYASLYEITGHDAGDAVDQAAADHRSASTSPAPVEITPSGTGRLAVAAVAWSPNGPS